METRVVERGSLNNARVSHSGRGARGEGRRGVCLSQNLTQKGADPGGHACTSSARDPAGELFRRVQCGTGARRTVSTRHVGPPGRRGNDGGKGAKRRNTGISFASLPSHPTKSPLFGCQWDQHTTRSIAQKEEEGRRPPREPPL
jgi:hypothetical protein